VLLASPVLSDAMLLAMLLAGGASRAMLASARLSLFISITNKLKAFAIFQQVNYFATCK